MGKKSKKLKRQQTKEAKQQQKNVVQKPKMTMKDRFLSFWSSRSPAVRFLSVFLLGMIGFYAFYYSPWYVINIHPLVVGVQAKIGALLTSLLGIDVFTLGPSIKGDKFAMDISAGCDGLEVTAILAMAILAFPTKWIYKLKGLAVGVSLIAFLNVLRFPLLYFTGMRGYNELFDFLHIQGGFIIFIGISLVIWVAWINWTIQSDRSLAGV